MSEGVGKHCNDRVLWRLICLINNLQEIKNATWLSIAYITNMKGTFP